MLHSGLRLHEIFVKRCSADVLQTGPLVRMVVLEPERLQTPCLKHRCAGCSRSQAHVVPAAEQTPKPSEYCRTPADASDPTKRHYYRLSMRIAVWSSARTCAQISYSSLPTPGTTEAGLRLPVHASHSWLVSSSPACKFHSNWPWNQRTTSQWLQERIFAHSTGDVSTWLPAGLCRDVSCVRPNCEREFACYPGTQLQLCSTGPERNVWRAYMLTAC